MRLGCKRTLPTQRQARCIAAAWSAAAFGLALTYLDPAALMAQQASSDLYVTGDAAVTGFSGALPPIQITPGVDPNTLTFIDPNGPSLRIVDLQIMSGAVAAQLVGAPKRFTVAAAQIGQVFGVALDDNTPPNIYAAATSAYGLPIVAPGTTGQPQHIQAGALNASFMPGLWGPQGGPGSIWKIDGATAKVSLFANVTLNGRTNSGAALGGLAYDPESKSLFVADRETGFIHRFARDGRELGRYDHGVTGRTAQGLPPVPWNSLPGINIASPQFDSAQPATWNYAAPERRIFGLAVYQRRLYYAVADSLQIWSVGLNPDGSFGNDAAIELAVPPSTGPTEISKITFDEQGRMFLADRLAPTGAFDFEALAVPAIGRVLRYASVGTTANGGRIWQQTPDEFAIGFPSQYRNDNGGVAIGYTYRPNGIINLGSCGGFMWTTGEDLRDSSDATLAAQLSQSGEVNVTGLQGNGTWLARPDNAPPLQSYFIDYADEFPDAAARGHMGDIAIARHCTPTQPASIIVPPLPSGFRPGPPGASPTCVPGYCPPTQTPGCTPNQPCGPLHKCMPWQICGPGGNPVCPPNELIRRTDNSCVPGCDRPNIAFNGQCCTVGSLVPGGNCSNSSCPPGQTAIGPSNFCCNSSQVYSGAGGAPACCSGTLVNGKCTPPPPPSTTNCAKGYVPIGNSCCLASKITSTGICCPAGQAPSGPNKSQCEKIVIIPIGPRCCASGIPTASGKCCPPANVTTSGDCCLEPVDPRHRMSCKVLIPLAECAPGYTKMPDGSCCNNRFIGPDGKSCELNRQSCPPGEFRNASGICVPIPSISCPPGQFRDGTGACRPIPSASCPPGESRNREGACAPIPSGACPPGRERNRSGECEPTPSPECPRGEVRNSTGACVRVELPPPIVGPVVPRRPIMPPPLPRQLGPRLPIAPPHGPIFRGPPGPAPFSR
jgi:hypothetical protein